jgi:hypothetical protein
VGRSTEIHLFLLRLKFSFKFRVSGSEVEDGLLMYAAQTDDGQGDFASVAIREKHLEFRFDTGSGTKSK